MRAIGRHLAITMTILFSLSAWTADQSGDIPTELPDKEKKLTITPQSISDSGESEAQKPQDSEAEEIDKALMKAVAEHQEEKKKAAEKKSQENSKNGKDESQIPVLTGNSEQKSAESSPYIRMTLSLVVIVVAALGMVFFAKWWQRNGKKDLDTTKIQVLTQHYVGPKKSLAIIRVAGESILVGITDNNISHIKTLSLIDDDVPEDVPDSFEDSLGNYSEADGEDQIVAQEMPKDKVTRTAASRTEDDEQIGSIKSRISSRLKEMRPL